jgi:hypothetical protein
MNKSPPVFSAVVVCTVWVGVFARVAASELIPGADAPVTVTELAQATQSARLQVTVRREGFVPYMPHANYRISIQAPPELLAQGWRCCWIEAYSKPTAALLRKQWKKFVAGNEPNVLLDAARSEASLRQVGLGLFDGYLSLSSPKETGSHIARIYVHLYQAQDVYIERTAYEFLHAPFVTVRFMYAPNSPHDAPYPRTTVPGAPLSQLPQF